MKLSRWTRRLLRTTRGQIILLLREKSCTVTELAAEVGLTNNAVRTHLATLERDGLVQQRGERAGVRKPHLSYELTKEADEIFTQAYGPILNQVVAVMKERIGEEEAETVMREAGRRLVPTGAVDGDTGFDQRLGQAVESLANLGARTSVVRKNGKILIRGAGCPLSTAAAEHGETCKMVETFLAEIIGVPVQQSCCREPSPRCCFEVEEPKQG